MYTNLGEDRKEGVRGSVYHALYIRVRRATRHTCTATRHTTSKRQQALPRRFFCFSNILDQNDDGIHTRTAEGEELVCIQGAACHAIRSHANSLPPRSLRRPCPRIACPDVVDRTACTAPDVTLCCWMLQIR